jgi:hypothetical protein
MISWLTWWSGPGPAVRGREKLGPPTSRPEPTR